MLGGIQILRSHLGGKRGRSKCESMRTEGKGKGLCECQRLHIDFFNLVPLIKVFATIIRFLVNSMKIPGLLCLFVFL